MDRIVKDFTIGNDSVQVGLIEYSENSKVIFKFNQFQSDAGLSSAILKTAKTDKTTNTHTALELAANTLFTASNGRRSVQTI